MNLSSFPISNKKDKDINKHDIQFIPTETLLLETEDLGVTIQKSQSYKKNQNAQDIDISKYIQA